MLFGENDSGGRRQRMKPQRPCKYLAGPPTEASTGEDVQAVARPEVPRENDRRDRAVLESAPAGRSYCVWMRRAKSRRWTGWPGPWIATDIGVNAYVSKRGGRLRFGWPSIAFNPLRCVLPLAFRVFPPYREHAGINKNNRKLIDSPLDEQFHREFCEPTESSQSIALLSPAAVDPA